MSNPNIRFWAFLGVLFAGFVLAIVAMAVFFYNRPEAAKVQDTRPPAVSLTRGISTPVPTLTEPLTPSPSPTPAPYGKIVFTCQIFAQQYRDQICVMNTDGSGYRVLTTDDNAENYYPSPAPDGNSLVYSSNRTGSYEIYEMNIDSGAITQLTHSIGEVNAPEISPDGRLIVFTDILNNLSRIWVMNRDGSNPHEVFSQAGTDSLDPTWSPDGKRILFAFGVGTDKSLYTVNLDSSGLHLVNAEFLTRGRTDWSPDGSLIASYGGSPWNWKMYLINADGSQYHAISVQGVALAPAFSPDGRWIVFTGYLDHPNDPDGCEIYIMRLDGSQVTRLTYNNYCDWQPRWGP